MKSYPDLDPDDETDEEEIERYERERREADLLWEHEVAKIRIPAKQTIPSPIH